MLTKILTIFIMILASNSSFALPNGFVYLKDIDNTIKSDLRYYNSENFTGNKIQSYNKNFVIMTKEAAIALSNAQKKFKKDGFEIILYDAYRPQTAVNYFYEWAKDINDQKKKLQYYPNIDKANLFELEYIMHKSGHSRGSTIDISILKLGDNISSIKQEKRNLKDNREIIYLNDNSIDMGSSFDLFDEASHYDNNLIEELFQDRRQYLREVMESCGWKHYDKEWWHFTLVDEKFKDQYFDFPIE